jgi:hypothetical protein
MQAADSDQESSRFPFLPRGSSVHIDMRRRSVYRRTPPNGLLLLSQYGVAREYGLRGVVNLWIQARTFGRETEQVVVDDMAPLELAYC